MTLPMLAHDKANHAIYGGLIFAVAGALLALAGVPHPRMKAAAIVLAFGLGKEALDAWRNWRARRRGEPAPHGVELLDAAWTTGGALLCWAAAEATANGGG